jgi:hypothetical protein
MLRAIILLLFMGAAPVTAQFTGRVSGRLEGWLGSQSAYNSRAVADLTGDWHLGRLRLDVFYGFRYWTTPHAATILNAEAGSSLERVHGVTATVRFGQCRVGGWIGRRAVLALGQPEVWGQTIGYYDGVAPLAQCQVGPLSVEGHGPLWRYQPLTLPWPLYEATLHLQQGLFRAEAYGSFGGPQPGAWDVRVEVGKTFRAGVYAGRLAAPDPGGIVSRVALVVSVGQ